MALPSSNSTQAGRPGLIYAWMAFFAIKGAFGIGILATVSQMMSTASPYVVLQLSVLLGIIYALGVIYIAVHFGLVFITFKARSKARWIIVAVMVYGVINDGLNVTYYGSLASVIPIAATYTTASIAFLIINCLVIYTMFRKDMKEYFGKARAS